MKTKKEQLKEYLDQHAEVKANLEKAQKDFNTFNNTFLAWLGSTLTNDEKQTNLHLTELLSLWDKVSND